MRDFLSKLLASFYNAIPQEIRVPVFNATSGVIGIFGTLFVADLSKLQFGNQYATAFVGFFIVLVPILVNYIQKKLVDRGDLLLAKEGNEKVLDVYNEKVASAQKIQAVAKKNR